MGLWRQASEIARQTPQERNRYVDFLRAVSILFVISGHWLIATAFFDVETGALHPVMMLDVQPWTQWLTWLFQVMPIFFIVGGYSNAMSLEAAQAKRIEYAAWLVARLHRLLTPVLTLVLFWAVFSFILFLAGARTETIIFASQASMVPMWFLAIYTMIVLLAPVAYSLWQRLGFYSIWVFVLLAAIVDVLFFYYGLYEAGWSNYFWVWLAMHQLGFAWRDKRFEGSSKLVLISAVAFVVLCALIFVGPYPLAMAGSPGEIVSNTLPPKITLIALGVFQFGLLLFIEKPMQSVLSGHRAWTCTVVVNSMIMSIYLWHMTVLILLMGGLYLFGGVGLTLEPGSAAWWWSRFIWIGVLLLSLLPVSLLVSPFERQQRDADALVPSPLRLIAGAIVIGLGIAFLAMYGFDGNPLSGFHIAALLLIVCGAVVCGLRVKLP